MGTLRALSPVDRLAGGGDRGGARNGAFGFSGGGSFATMIGFRKPRWESRGSVPELAGGGARSGRAPRG